MKTNPLLPVLLAAAIPAACVIQEAPPPQPPIQNTQAATAADRQVESLAEGEYRCNLAGYEDFTCVIAPSANGLTLDKVSGSQRVRGLVTPTPDGFDFDGTFFCPWGSCTEPVSARFVRVAPGVYEGQLPIQSGPTTLQLTFEPAGSTALGGSMYGGGGYGGGGYGGAGS